MKLWEKGIPTLQAIENFTVGKDRELDMYLAPFDVLGTMAHCLMLESIGLLDKAELSAILAALKQIYQQIQAGQFAIAPEVEDVHSQIELLLTQTLGEAGKKVHSGRSRNDQVLLDIKLFMRHEIERIVQLCDALITTLLALSETHRQALMPGYTHLQVAMPSSFGLWFGAYAEALAEDLMVLQGIFKTVNQNPLGTAAGYGSSFPLDRQLTTRLLGFENVAYNAIHAQMGRGKIEKNVCFGLANIAQTLSKMAMDITLFASQDMGFVSLPDALTTGSSIMPHKKNPDVFELIRAKCNRLQSLPYQMNLITQNLPSGYHRDWQILKEDCLPAFDQLAACLTMLGQTLPELRIKPNILQQDKYAYLFSVEQVNGLVMQGVPFRDAYRQVADLIAQGQKPATASLSSYTHEGSLGNLATEAIRAKQRQAVESFGFGSIHQALAYLFDYN
ncbi:MAG TPA: argininosuccinate lyase [Microscillaceae bacterium]|jgi:argininosuccinate lyase|nr:argininosuccinate lyase [Microscillaceae bacterium]